MEKLNLTKVKFRASEIGTLVGALQMGLTEAQDRELKKLQDKIESGKKLTPLQEIKIKELQDKKTAPPMLTKGGVSFLETKLKELIFGRRKEITTKQMEKGTDVENESIEIYSDVTGQKYIKNDLRHENDWISGEFDLEQPDDDKIIDIKSSWDLFTFPMFKTKLDNNIYKWQVKAYAWLTGRTKGEVAYVLTNTPENIIQDEIFRFGRNNGMIDVPLKIEKEIRKQHTYDDIPYKFRVKRFEVEIEPEKDAEIIKIAVETARQYLIELSHNLG